MRKSKQFIGATVIVGLFVLGAVVMAFRSTARNGSDSNNAPVAPPVQKPSTSWPAYQNGGEMRGCASELPLRQLTLRWELDIGKGARGSAAIVNGMAYIGGPKGDVFAIDIKTGQIKWKYTLKTRYITTPLVHKDALFIADTSGVVHSIALATGQPVWTYETGSEIKSSANRLNDNIYFGAVSGMLYCVNAATGKETWKVQTDDQVHTTAAIVEGLAFFGGCDAHLRAIDAVSGVQKWASEMSSQIAMAAVGFDGKVVAGALGGDIVCFTIADGKEVWRRSFEGEEFFSAFAYSDGALIAPGRRQGLYCMDGSTGAHRWALESAVGFEAAAVISGQGVYAPGKDGKLHVLNIKDGTEVWFFAGGGSMDGSPAIGDGVLLVCDASGKLYCLEP